MNTSRLGTPGPAMISVLVLSWIGICGPLVDPLTQTPPSPAVSMHQQDATTHEQS